MILSAQRRILSYCTLRKSSLLFLSSNRILQAAAFTSKVVVVTSGKGGVGKTTTAASFAYGLAEEGYKTCVIDFDIGLRYIDR